MRCQESWTLTYLALAFFLVVHRAGSVSESAAEFNIARAPAPLFNGMNATLDFTTLSIRRGILWSI
jgi:hypothetical protein